MSLSFALDVARNHAGPIREAARQHSVSDFGLTLRANCRLTMISLNEHREVVELGSENLNKNECAAKSKHFW
jgi:hypothetical protein